MALLKIHDDECESFADGLEEASRLVQGFSIIDPVLLRSAASALSARATSVFELGVSAGLRLCADDAADLQLVDTIPDLQSEIRRRG